MVVDLVAADIGVDSEEGATVYRALVSGGDIEGEHFLPLVLERLGIGVGGICNQLRAARLELLPSVGLTVEQTNPNASVLVRIAGRRESIRLSKELASQILVRAA